MRELAVRVHEAFILSCRLQLCDMTKLSTEPRCHAICMCDVIGVPTQDIVRHGGLKTLIPKCLLRTKTEGQPPDPKQNAPQNHRPRSHAGPNTGAALIQARPHDTPVQCMRSTEPSACAPSIMDTRCTPAGLTYLQLLAFAAASGMTGPHAEQRGDPLPTLEARLRACRYCGPHAAPADDACACDIRTMGQEPSQAQPGFHAPQP